MKKQSNKSRKKQSLDLQNEDEVLNFLYEECANRDKFKDDQTENECLLPDEFEEENLTDSE